MRFTHQSLYHYSLLSILLLVGGCAESPVVKTPVGWYHSLEGGIIAQPRLPPPGKDQQYPYVGLTPKSAPPLPSPALRQEITNSLAADRNLSNWQDVTNPLTIPKIAPPPQQIANTQPQNKNDAKSPDTGKQQNDNNQESSATLDAAGQDPQPTQSTNPVPNNNTEPKSSKPAPKPEKPKQAPEVTGPVVMPEVRTQIDEQTVVLPAIPVNPPTPSNFPGFHIPSDMNLPSLSHPSGLSLETPTGELIKFPIDSDAPDIKQEGIIHKYALQRQNRTIFVHGYGDASSISPEGQANAISLALLRAKTVAKMLIANNVPESAIVIRAHAIGHGVRLRMDQ